MRRYLQSAFPEFFNSNNAAAIVKAGCATIAMTANAYAQCGIPPKFTEDVGGPARPSESVPQNSALPSSLIYYVHHQNHLQPEWNQQEIAWPLIEIARTEGLDDYERFFWAQLNFMSFKANEAYDLFSEFIERDDWYGWMARHRHTIMDTRAFQNFERLEESIAIERENFTFRPEFASITGFGEQSLCFHWASEREHERAVSFAVETATATPRDAAYGPLYAMIACYSSFEETGREQEAFELAEAISNDLKAALAERNKTADQHRAYDPHLHENQVEDGWYGRSLIAPYNYQTYKMEQMVRRFDALLACRRDGQKEVCESPSLIMDCLSMPAHRKHTRGLRCS